MDLKKIAVKAAKQKLVNEAQKKIIPMPDVKKPLSTKTKIAGVLATIAAVAAALISSWPSSANV